LGFYVIQVEYFSKAKDESPRSDVCISNWDETERVLGKDYDPLTYVAHSSSSSDQDQVRMNFQSAIPRVLKGLGLLHVN